MTRPAYRPAPRQNEQGSALVYILIAIALLAALTVSFMQPSGNQTQSQNVFRTVSELQSQADFIRAAVQECVLSYPGGDATIARGPTGTDPGADHRYPLKPNSTHLVSPAGDREVRHLRCPGNPGDNNNHTPIFGGATGKFLPPPPALFDAWQWYNGDAGVFFWISSSNSDAFIGDAFTRLAESFSDTEADIVTGPANLDGAPATVTCPANNRCFRIWMIRRP